MKHLYINSRLHPLTLAIGGIPPRTWIFSGGEPWLLLTPARMERLAADPGLEDMRVLRLLGLIRRHSPSPAAFCLPLGLDAEPQMRPEEYPPVLCPRCDGLHNPHPEEAGKPCPDCNEKDARAERLRPGGRVVNDRRLDRVARKTFQENHPECFDGRELSPNWKLNYHRRLYRDWESAINRIFMGCGYREVAREFDCSVGLLHKKVQENKHWENN